MQRLLGEINLLNVLVNVIYLSAVAPLLLIKETAMMCKDMWGTQMTRHRLFTECHLASCWQIAAAGPSLEMLHGLPKCQVGTGGDSPSSATCCCGALPLCWVFASRISVPTGSAGRGCAELCQHQRKGRREKEWWGQELLTSAWLSTYISVAECQLVPSSSPETTCHQHGFKKPLSLIFLKIVELSAHNLTAGVSKHSAI